MDSISKTLKSAGFSDEYISIFESYIKNDNDVCDPLVDSEKLPEIHVADTNSLVVSVRNDYVSSVMLNKTDIGNK